jgi:predicted ATP-dependent endonuclease of OLD family
MSMQILTSVKAENFVAFAPPLDWHGHGSLNVIIGENDTGKTHLLTLPYAMTTSR